MRPESTPVASVEPEVMARRRLRRWQLVLAVAAGICAGVAGTVLLLRPAVVAELETPAERVVDGRGRATSRPQGARLRAGDRIKAGASSVVVVTSSQTRITLAPRAELSMSSGAVVA